MDKRLKTFIIQNDRVICDAEVYCDKEIDQQLTFLSKLDMGVRVAPKKLLEETMFKSIVTINDNMLVVGWPT